MPSSPAEITLELRPRHRIDVIDVSERILSEFGDLLGGYRRALYCSHHTTAGYFDQRLCDRLQHSSDRLTSFIQVFHRLFPPGADYRHDRLELRSELTEEQKRNEPLNADSHLKFIGAGLENCVTYDNQAENPVFFVDLDGTYRKTARKRRTTVIGFDRERVVERLDLDVPVSRHPIDSVNLRDPRLGVFQRLDELVARHGVHRGRVDLRLEPGEQNAGLTVNEYETLLMTHDLAEVLRDPVRHMATKGRRLLRDPRTIPGRTKDYAQFDLVQVMNELLDVIGVSNSVLERIVARFLAFPATRFLRLKRSVRLLVSDVGGAGDGSIVQGTYQSPILVQWRATPGRTRRLRATLTSFS
jgi:thiamine phosphate synthase YjbQ (UPF0047 family)